MTCRALLAGVALLGAACAAPPDDAPADATVPTIADAITDTTATLDLPGEPDADPAVDVADTGGIVPDGDFGAPCLQNADCASGWCIEGPDGPFCTQVCFDECPDGMVCRAPANTGPDLVFLCVPLVQGHCNPCLVSDQCPGGLCAALGDGTFCTTACDAGADCPVGYDCEAGRCAPASGSCACRADTAGQQRACGVANAHGACSGFETCDPAAGWTGCTALTPGPETCDGADNDCDGLVDEELAASQPCERSNDHGTCSGAARCVGSAGWLCDAPEPAAETCDFVDNDCSGVADDPFVDAEGRYTDPAHCGTCGNACAGKYPGALTTACDATGPTPLCVVATCKPGFFKLSPFQCIVPPNAACKPCDTAADCFGADCIQVQGASVCSPACAADAECDDGLTCQGGHCLPPNGTCDCDATTVGAKRSCSAASDLGQCFGFQTCDPATGWSACDATTPAPEVCDGVDNDCDGAVDDGLTAPPCALQAGVCAGAERLCGGGAGWLPCGTANLPATYEPTELTCDGLDNDCDGQTDEGLKGPACALTLGVCAGVSNLCVGGEFTGCNYGASYEPDEVSCDGLDNDCDGLVDNVDQDGDGFSACSADCDDTDPAVHPAADENCATPADDDCSGVANDRDLDFDGFLAPACGGDDCNDLNPLIHASAAEVCGDGLDNDCSGVADDRDIDGDGFVAQACGGPDCSDVNPLVWPGAPEICGDAADNDCNGAIDDKDADGDGVIDLACGGKDCNDATAAARPGLAEVCGDGLDNDCDGSIDNKDLDKDSFLDPACGGIDCNDAVAAVHPGLPEVCDGLDNDCNGVIDDKDLDKDGHLDVACPGGDDCNDQNPAISPSAKEQCGDGVDNDCSGADGDKDLDGDGFVDLSPACAGGNDCDDLDPLVYPGATEIYDTKDTDCDGTVDEGLIAPGTVVISELMVNPAAVDDGLGEWFEVTNVGVLPVNLASWRLSDENTPTPDSWTLPASERILVAPGGAAVLCRNPNPALNGGIDCDGGYDDLILAQAGDEVVLSLAGVQIDRVAYGGTGWPPVLAGISLSLDPNQLSASGNDKPGSWCQTPSGGGAHTLPGGDRGTPGKVNPSCSGAPAITSVHPAHGIDNGGDAVTLTGSGFTGASGATVGGNPCQGFEVLSDNQIRCLTPPGNAGLATVAVSKGAQSASLAAGFRYTGEAVKAIDWCDIQWPASLQATAGQPTGLIYGQVHSPGVTGPAGAPGGIVAEVGYGPPGTDPRNQPGWTWTAAVWHAQYFQNDEFQQTLTVPSAGTWAFGYRFSDDGGINYMYCDFDPGTADGFQVGDLGELTVF